VQEGLSDLESFFESSTWAIDTELSNAIVENAQPKNNDFEFIITISVKQDNQLAENKTPGDEFRFPGRQIGTANRLFTSP
jgi:hypothetical protein